MTKREDYIKLMKKFIYLHESGQILRKIEETDIKYINELLGYGYFDKNVFKTLVSDNAAGVMTYRGGNPLTLSGKEYLEMGWYLRFKLSGKFQIARDLFAFIGGAAGVIAIVLQIYTSFKK